jgi:hypothetical protein
MILTIVGAGAVGAGTASHYGSGSATLIKTVNLKPKETAINAPNFWQMFTDKSDKTA